MKKAFMLLGLAAVVLATSCEREDLNKVNNTPKTFEGDVAYIVVNINDVNDVATRATSSGFEYGTSDEYAIYDAHFYFYDSYGEYVASSDATPTGGTASADTPINIEFKANTVLTLHGLSGTNYPNWVVTVLNQPEAFVAPDHLADFPATLAETTDDGAGTLGEHGIFSKGVGVYVDSNMYYTMSTSSFDPTDSDAANAGYSSEYYFATPVVAENFSIEEVNQETWTDGDGWTVVPVEIYVERLVAKTRVVTNLGGGTTLFDECTYYPISVQEEAADADGNLEIDEDVTLYVRLDGWRLNGISTDSYMSKRIDTSWGSSSSYDWGWNDATNYRSYWAMSTAYGDTDVTWPSSSEGKDYDGAKNDLNEYLRWVDLQDTYLHAFSSDVCEYCAENTNTAGDDVTSSAVIKSKKSTAITNALIKATVGRIEDSTFTPLDLVRAGGVLYTKENYCVYAASHILLYISNDSKASFTSVGPDYLMVVDDNDGYVHVELNTTALASAGYYEVYETAAVDADGKTFSDGNSYIDEHFNSIYGYMANGYTGGAMYYSVPIEHLNNDYSKVYTGNDDGEEHTLVLEGNYGIVRNHIYNITITGIENIGWGIYNPQEVIIPQEDVDTYAITANINVLSWKLVNQSVTL